MFDELKPCKCGGKGKGGKYYITGQYNIGHNVYIITCQKCGLKYKNDNREKAVTSWNEEYDNSILHEDIVMEANHE